jgi:exportin-2 (importin alpha re-exporter)
MAASIEQVAQLLTSSLNPSQRKDAEQALKAAESSPAFSILLLQIVANPSSDSTLRLSSALYFKNFIRRNWTVSAYVL